MVDEALSGVGSLDSEVGGGVNGGRGGRLCLVEKVGYDRFSETAQADEKVKAA